jgi:hypothetical protein
MATTAIAARPAAGPTAPVCPARQAAPAGPWDKQVRLLMRDYLCRFGWLLPGLGAGRRARGGHPGRLTGHRRGDLAAGAAPSASPGPRGRLLARTPWRWTCMGLSHPALAEFCGYDNAGRGAELDRLRVRRLRTRRPQGRHRPSRGRLRPHPHGQTSVGGPAFSGLLSAGRRPPRRYRGGLPENDAEHHGTRRGTPAPHRRFVPGRVGGRVAAQSAVENPLRRRVLQSPQSTEPARGQHACHGRYLVARKWTMGSHQLSAAHSCFRSPDRSG